MATPRERFEVLTHKWFLTEPALFEVFCTHDLQENNSLPIPLRSGKGRIEYNAEQIDLLSDPALDQLMKVEMVRLCLRHPYERQPTGCSPKALHIGSDMVIEPAYDVPLAELTAPGDMKLPDGQHFEWYADRVNELLREELKKLQQSGGKIRTPQGDSLDSGGRQQGADQQSGESQESDSQKGDQQSGESQSGDTQKGDQQSGESQSGDTQKDDQQDGEQGGNKSGEQSGEATDGSAQGGTPQPNGDSQIDFSPLDDAYTGLWQEDEEMMEKLKETLQKITNWGTVPANVVDVIQKALRARIDYRKVLRAFQTSIISTNRNLTRMRPNRRFGFDAMGSKHDMTSRLLVAIDVSGSVTKQALGKFFCIITNFFKNGVDEIDVIQFDYTVKEEVLKLRKGCKELKESSFKIHGRGGTNFQSVIDYLQQHNNYDGLVFFTDGEATEPVISFPTRARVLWVVETEQEYNSHKSWMTKKGRACYIM